MKCQILFSEKNKKNITNLSSAKLAQMVVRVEYVEACISFDIYCVWSKCSKMRKLQNKERELSYNIRNEAQSREDEYFLIHEQ